jgi:hypothetical protein
LQAPAQPESLPKAVIANSSPSKKIGTIAKLQGNGSHSEMQFRPITRGASSRAFFTESSPRSNVSCTKKAPRFGGAFSAITRFYF